jgi:hypothetical protein
MVLHGGCHCGNITLTLRWEPDPAEIRTRACTCSFCTRHGAAWIAYPAGVLRVKLADPARVSAYAFETRTAELHVCARCGVVPVATSSIEGRLYAVVNAKTLVGVEPALLVRAPISFDGEATGARLERRARAWIGDVELAT